MDNLSISFTTKACQKLKRIGKTQKELASEIDIDYSTLNKILNNKRELDYSTAVKIANSLNMSLDKTANKPTNQSFENLMIVLEDLVFNLKQVNVKE